MRRRNPEENYLRSDLTSLLDPHSILIVSNMKRTSTNLLAPDLGAEQAIKKRSVQREGPGETGSSKWESETDRVFELLRNDLIAGLFAPREPLSETELAKRYGASRTPVRGAMIRLIEYRLLESHPFASTSVREISPRDITQIYEMRQAVEGFALETAGAWIHDEQLERLLAVYDATSADGVLGIVPEAIFHKGVTPLHMLIIESLGNGRLTDVLCTQSMSIARTQALYWRMAHPRVDALESERRRAALQEHREIVVALLDHDAVSARASLIEHLDRGADHLLRIMTTIDLEEPSSHGSAHRVSRQLPNLLDHMIHGIDTTQDDPSTWLPRQ